MIKRLAANYFNQFIIVVCLIGNAASLARPPNQRVNMREGCRQTVSGGYLKVYDERESARLYVKTLGYSIDEVSAAVKDTKARYIKERAAADGAGYDLQKAVTADQTAAQIRTLESRLDDYKQLKGEAEVKYKSLVAVEKSLRTSVEFVFRFDRTEDKPDGGYPIRLEYKTACSKYRYLCPLPKKEADKLVAIKLDGETPEECQRYASQSQIKN